MSLSTTSTETFLGHQVAFAQKDEFKRKLSRLRASGLSGLRVVSDFDFTMSKFYLNGQRGASCHKVIEDCGLLPHEYHIQAQGLQKKYYPLEVDPTLDMEEKTMYMIEWVEQAHDLLMQHGLKKQHIQKAVSEALATGRIELRANIGCFLRMLREHQVPLLIFSAGIADVLEEVLRLQCEADWEHAHVISNRCIFHPETLAVEAFEQPLLHVFNKRSSAYLHTPFFKLDDIDQRQCLLLLGDSLGDVSMSEGMGIPEDSVLKVGFLNDRTERLPQYLECYDLVILGDPGFDVPLRLVEIIAQGLQGGESGFEVDGLV